MRFLYLYTMSLEHTTPISPLTPLDKIPNLVSIYIIYLKPMDSIYSWVWGHTLEHSRPMRGHALKADFPSPRSYQLSIAPQLGVEMGLNLCYKHSGREFTNASILLVSRWHRSTPFFLDLWLLCSVFLFFHNGS